MATILLVPELFTTFLQDEFEDWIQQTKIDVHDVEFQACVQRKRAQINALRMDGWVGMSSNKYDVLCTHFIIQHVRCASSMNPLSFTSQSLSIPKLRPEQSYTGETAPRNAVSKGDMDIYCHSLMYI